MNEGLLAILIVAATIGAAIWVAIHRDVIYPPPARPATRPRHGSVIRRPARARNAAETDSKPTPIISSGVSGITTPKDDPEMIALRALAKLIAGKLITETVALETVFDVRAGSSKAYKALQKKLKIVQAEMGPSSPAMSQPPTAHDST